MYFAGQPGGPGRLFLSIMLTARAACPQARTVAITVDDLPYAGTALTPPRSWETAASIDAHNGRLLAAFKARRVPVTGFVNQKGAEFLGASGIRILKKWTGGGSDLGNHMYSHPDINDLSEEQIEEEIVRGESAIRPLMQGAGRPLLFLRFPFNHTGDSPGKHGATAAFLAHRGYQVATCTIDTSDYVFDDAYVRSLVTHDARSAQRLRTAYLDYTEIQIDYYAGLNRQVLGYEPPHVMLLHDNRLNGDVIGDILRIFEKKGYRFVSLKTAQADPAYRIPDTWTTKFGPMWGYRWAKVRGVKVDFSQEQDPPQWVVEYGKTATAATSVHR